MEIIFNNQQHIDNAIFGIIHICILIFYILIFFVFWHILFFKYKKYNNYIFLILNFTFNDTRSRQLILLFILNVLLLFHIFDFFGNDIHSFLSYKEIKYFYNMTINMDIFMIIFKMCVMIVYFKIFYNFYYFLYFELEYALNEDEFNIYHLFPYLDEFDTLLINHLNNNNHNIAIKLFCNNNKILLLIHEKNPKKIFCFKIKEMQTINLLKNYNTILYITNINNIVDLEYLIQNLNISSIKIVKSFKSLRYVNNYKMNDWNSKDYNKKIFEINNKYKINNLDNINRILSNNEIQSIKIYKNNIKLLQQLHYLNINKLYIHIKNITTIAQLSFSASNLIILINNKHESITIKDALFLIDTITNFNTKSIKIMNLIITNNNDL